MDSDTGERYALKRMLCQTPALLEVRWHGLRGELMALCLRTLGWLHGTESKAGGRGADLVFTRQHHSADRSRARILHDQQPAGAVPLPSVQGM